MFEHVEPAKFTSARKPHRGEAFAERMKDGTWMVWYGPGTEAGGVTDAQFRDDFSPANDAGRVAFDAPDPAPPVTAKVEKPNAPKPEDAPAGEQLAELKEQPKAEEKKG